MSDLNSRGVEVELKLTAGPGDAAELAAQAARNGSTDVIVAGGDGTINEAIQGMVGTNARLGILPRGTANVLARELGLPMNVDDGDFNCGAGKISSHSFRSRDRRIDKHKSTLCFDGGNRSRRVGSPSSSTFTQETHWQEERSGCQD